VRRGEHETEPAGAGGGGPHRARGPYPFLFSGLGFGLGFGALKKRGTGQAGALSCIPRTALFLKGRGPSSHAPPHPKKKNGSLTL